MQDRTGERQALRNGKPSFTLFTEHPETQRETTADGNTVDRRKETRHELIAEIEEVERRLKAVRTKLRETTLLLASAERRERERLAQILHDSLQQILVAAKWNLTRVEQDSRVATELKDSLSQISDLLEQSIEQTRALTLDLSPPALKGGILPNLEWLAHHFEESYGLEVRIRTEGDFRFVSDVNTEFLFHAIRELAFNAAKHSQADRVDVWLKMGPRSVAVTVSDPGVGFDPAELEQKRLSGFGLSQIISRVERMGGELRVRSAPNQGATFLIILPV